MNNQPRRKRGLLTSLAAVTTAMIMALSAAPAHADGPVIDPAAQGTLHIHKYEQPAQVGAEGNGLKQDVTGLTAMKDIEFSAQRVDDVDLTTNEGWTKAAEMSTAGVMPTLVGPVFESGPTDANGLATIAKLPVGLYYVTETVYPDNVTPVVPFLVTMPMTHPTELNTWLYDVHVYPKNATTTAEKSVDDAAGVKIGDTIEWTILGDIPKAQDITGYKIVDVLDPKLEFVSAVVSLTGTPGVTLESGKDYKLAFDAPSRTATVEFTKPGRDKLALVWQADKNSQVKVSVKTKVLKVGEIANTATVFPNDSDKSVTTNEVFTKWGNIILDKVDSVNGKKLTDAEFQVFETKANAKAKTNPISIDGKDTFRSDGGVVLIEGLRYSNWENGEEVLETSDNYRWYWIAETKAPGGYELLAQPIKVDVTSFQETVSVEVKNIPKNAGFKLPLTGASGASSIIMVAGLLLLVVGTSAVVVSRRKRGQVQA